MSEFNTPAEVFPVGDYLREELEARGWSAAEFADILDRPVQAVSEILNGKKEITTETAIAIGAALGTSAEVWLNLQMKHRLYSTSAPSIEKTNVERRAHLRSMAPIRELQRIGWLPDTNDLDHLEAAACEFFDIESIDHDPTYVAAARRSNEESPYAPQQLSWMARVRNLGRKRSVNQFSMTSLKALAEQLVGTLRDPGDLHSLQARFAEVGVILVIVLPLKGSKIDGVVIWDRDMNNPIVGLSTRGDRMDSFVFTLLHEVAHILLRHVSKGKSPRLDECLFEDNGSDQESEASELAGQWIIRQPLELGSKMDKPSIQRVLSAARSLGVHPSFVIGRLWFDGVLEGGDFRRSIPKVRNYVEVD